MTDRIRIPFADVPLGESFYDPQGEYMLKVGFTTASNMVGESDEYLNYPPDLFVSIDPRKLS
jgi:hypothetical protein